MKTHALALVLALGGGLLVGCGDDDGTPVDAVDASQADGGGTPIDAGSIDAGATDAGSVDPEDDAGIDADAGSDDDAGVEDDAGIDADGGTDDDAGVESDAGVADGGTGGMDAGIPLGPTPGPGDLVIVELQGNPVRADDEEAEYIEILNVSRRELDLRGVHIAHVSWTGGEPARSTGRHVISESVRVGPGERVLLARSSGGFFGGATVDYVYDQILMDNAGGATNRMRLMVPSWTGTEPPDTSDLIDEVRTAPGAFRNDLRGRAIQLHPARVPSTGANDDPASWCHAPAVDELEYREDNWGTPRAPNRCD